MDKWMDQCLGKEELSDEEMEKKVAECLGEEKTERVEGLGNFAILCKSPDKLHDIFTSVDLLMTLILCTFPVGEPIPVSKVDKPSQEQIDELHSQYCKSLRALYDEYNPIYGDSNVGPYDTEPSNSLSDCQSKWSCFF